MDRKVDQMAKPGTALLVMDVQEALVGMCPTAPAAVDRISAAITKARAAQLPVIFGAVRLRATHSDVSDRNAMFVQVAASGAFDDEAPTARIHAAVTPEDGDITFVKRRVSAFAGSDLDVVLRSLGVDSLVLTGLFTSGVVLSTLREAADRDFQLTVLSDACADPDDDVHDFLLTKIFPSQSAVQTVDSWDIRSDISGG
jgi:nicotinamidase-related amidase